MSSVGIRNRAAGDHCVQIPEDTCSSPEQKFRSGISGPPMSMCSALVSFIPQFSKMKLPPGVDKNCTCFPSLPTFNISIFFLLQISGRVGCSHASCPSVHPRGLGHTLQTASKVSLLPNGTQLAGGRMRTEPGFSAGDLLLLARRGGEPWGHAQQISKVVGGVRPAPPLKLSSRPGDDICPCPFSDLLRAGCTEPYFLVERPV